MTKTPNRTPDGRLACAHGSDWMGPLACCAAALERDLGLPPGSVPVPDFSRAERRRHQPSLFDERSAA